MAYCPNCNEQRPDHQRFCGVCGAQLAASTPVQPSPTPPPQYPQQHYPYASPSGPSDGGYFSFSKFISPTLIKIAYVIGVILITIGGIVLMVSPIGQVSVSHGSPVLTGGEGFCIVFGLLWIFLGNLIWRVVCESWIVLFNMRDLLASVERESRRR